MSRPQALLHAFRAAFPRRPVTGAAPRFSTSSGSSSRARFDSRGFTWRFGSARHASGDSSVHTASLRSTIFRPITFILILAPLLTGYLGVWQVQRLKWKVALIEEVNQNLAKDPMALPAKIK